MTTSGISNMGGSAENRFRSLTNSTKPSPASLGDAELDGNFAEVKKVSSDTLNQVRAVKYSTLVAYDSVREKWFVVPAVKVVQLVADKSRGQHSENPFESATISLAKLDKYETAEGNLVGAWENAIAQSEARLDVKLKMAQIKLECADLAKKHRDEVQSLFQNEN
jgi:hypothetical protein